MVLVFDLKIRNRAAPTEKKKKNGKIERIRITKLERKRQFNFNFIFCGQ